MSPLEAELRARAPVARKVAARWRRRCPPGVDPTELLGAAMVGLWRALDAAQRRHPGRALSELGEGVLGWYAGREVAEWLRTVDSVPRGHRERERALGNPPPRRPREVEPRDAVDTTGTDAARAELDLARARIAELERLDPRRRAVVRGHLAGERWATIGAELGVSESRACQLLAEVRRLMAEHPELWGQG